MQEISHTLEVVGVLLVALSSLIRLVMRMHSSRKGCGKKARAKKRTTTRKDTPARTTRKQAGAKKTQGRKKPKNPLQ